MMQQQLEQFTVPADLVARWFRVALDMASDGLKTDLDLYDYLECFWESQLLSKLALLEAVHSQDDFPMTGTVYIFGGWHGVLSSLILYKCPAVSRVVSVDIDPKCAVLGPCVTDDSRAEFVTMDMKDFTNHMYASDTCLIINTSTEHVTQETFDAWDSQRPYGVMTVLQGNNFFDIPSHIRCARNMADFRKINRVVCPIHVEGIDCGLFTRFMTITK